MTEQEHIDATNLAKVRIASTIVRDTIVIDDEAQEHLRTKIMKSMCAWMDNLEKIVSCEPDESDKARSG